MNKDKFLNTYINNITMDETVQNIEQMIQNGQKAYVTPINVDVVMKMEKDEKLKEIIQDESISIGKIKSTMKQVVPTYKEPEEVNKKKKENINVAV